MITREVVGEAIAAYLNKDITLEQLVNWAEHTLVYGGFGPAEDVDIILDVVTYLASSGSPFCPLGSQECNRFMQHLGMPVVSGAA